MAETGSLRTYLGTAPGVGKTFRMLAEGRERAADGERVVIGWLETHGRAETSRQAEGLQVIEPRAVANRGSVFPEFDPAAAIASGADVVLVDELAHVAGSQQAAVGRRRGRAGRRAGCRDHRQCRAPSIGAGLCGTGS